ncbi:carboxylesterase [Abiotrophia sp.]|uniref:alpha/beta hydrolase n=1 Tax=Abiotrophia sp. TaxID=76631 RepID=UPI0027BA1344|nr:alpha/beta fold hydrolase [Abiotrophia sp.]
MPLSKGAYYLEVPGARLGIILCHAYTGSTADVRPQAGLLNRQGYGVLCPLFTGHGTTDIQDILNAGPEIWWQDLQEALAFMKKRYEKVLVFGLSMGGVMAMRALCEADSQLLGGGVFNSPVISRDGLQLENRFMSFARYLAEKRGDLPAYLQTEEAVRTAHRQQVADIQAFARDFEDQLASIELPVYIVQSAQDELVDPEAVYDLLEALESAKISFHWCEENTHVITTNRNRSDFEASLLQFIQAFDN